MNKRTKDKTLDFDVAAGNESGADWSAEKLAGVKRFAQINARLRTPEQHLKNSMLAIRFQMEEYIAATLPVSQVQTVDSFLKCYLRELRLPFNRFARVIGTTDSNLKKYTLGKRKLNSDLAMKLGSFFHTRPELWLNVQIKNELLELQQEKKHLARYKKYDYTKLAATGKAKKVA